MATATQERTERKVISVAPFAIEIDHPRNCDVLLQSIPGLRLRSAIDGSKGHTDRRGDSHVPVDQSQTLASFPKTPGMRLAVKPAERSYAVIDPMEDDESLLDRVGKWLRTNSPFRTDKKLKGAAPKRGALDAHRMKTLVREMVHMVNMGTAKVVSGAAPDQAAIDALPGRYLLNAGCRVPNTMPIFEDQMDAWLAKRRGGDGDQEE